MKEIQVLGVRVKDGSLRESLKLADGYLRNGALNTVVYLSSKLLVDAGSNELQKEWIEKADLTVFGDPTIMRSIKSAEHRIHEVEEDIFLSEFLKKIVRMNRSVFLLTDTKERLNSLKNELHGYQDNITIVGEYVFDIRTDSFESLMNEINGATPSVVISRVSYEDQARFMEESRKFLNADIWIGLLDHPAGIKTQKSRFAKLMRTFYRGIFYLDVKRNSK